MKKILSLIFLLLVPQIVFAKNLDTFGAMTFLSLSKKISQYGTLSFYHYDVFSFEKKEFQGRTYPAGMIQTYFQTSYTYQYLPLVGLTLGHIYQRNNPFTDEFQNENRIFEQITFGVNYRNFTMSHRVRFEERFIEVRDEDKTDFRTRLRYQVGAKIPLRGLVIDPKEYYINTYNEVYFSTTGERNAFFSDDWVYLGLGKQTKSMGSFEIGPLVQWSRVNQDKDTRTHYNIQLGWLYAF
jgi:hypothetical protein